MSLHQEQVFVQYDKGLKGEVRCIVKGFGTEGSGTEATKGEALSSALTRLADEIRERARHAV